MKKVLLVCAMGAFLFSCGKSACDCKKESEELMKDAFAAAMSGDESAAKDMEAKVKELEEDCKDYTLEDYKDCK
jgi:hypothetical protein